ncbi:phosphoglycolate phosphatase [Thioalkalivibrio paradoxus]|uniref:phosphoglycolate phosphatase n=1 Tax=Thioalkalivibrio paradoxus ARh 1 TaxID=713585 RepID=W0DIE0_9GAMM|nr:phosphoglycolate phosphatase [Thioalkalivibrio paradoxus]AHE98394.1 phosphoglycolate phosphatase [Thioalkalivibrio paradoxus ARh 1]
MKHLLRGVLFDLDGTLLDTAPDMHAALDRLLQEERRPPLPFPAVRNHVSHGSKALVELGFPGANGATRERLKQRYLEIYAEDLCRHTALFPGMAEVLDELERLGLRVGVVTNKPAWLTEPLLDALGLSARLASIVSGDTLPQRKPAPEPMWLAARQSGAEPGEMVYIGDAERDIAAGRAAGMHTLIAGWGYIDPSEDPESWQADGSLAAPADFWVWADALATGREWLAS